MNVTEAGQAHVCEHCGENTARVSQRTHHFSYGTGGASVELSALVPVLACDACGEPVLTDEAQDIIHETICRHLGRMTPGEIRGIRTSFGLRQEDLGDLTGYGSASIKRWEAGTQIQSDSVDKHLRLLRSLGPDEARRRVQSAPSPRFRTELGSSILGGERTFCLRAQASRRVLEAAA